eukprot:Filipodium_phascolosomae@DN4394_c0_g1_i1.p1
MEVVSRYLQALYFKILSSSGHLSDGSSTNTSIVSELPDHSCFFLTSVWQNGCADAFFGADSQELSQNEPDLTDKPGSLCSAVFVVTSIARIKLPSLKKKRDAKRKREARKRSEAKKGTTWHDPKSMDHSQLLTKSVDAESAAKSDDCGQDGYDGLNQSAILTDEVPLDGELKVETPADEAMLSTESIMVNVAESYWNLRYRLFSKFNAGVLIDVNGWHETTPEPIAAYIAHKFADCRVIVDACCGIGGNTIQFCSMNTECKVIGVDLDETRIRIARNNANVYGIPPSQLMLLNQDLETFCKFFHESYSETEVDLVFSAPPWGGPSYLASSSFSMKQVLTADFVSILLSCAKLKPRIIAIYIPRNSLVGELVQIACRMGYKIIEFQKIFTPGLKVCLAILSNHILGVTARGFKNPYSYYDHSHFLKTREATGQPDGTIHNTNTRINKNNNDTILQFLHPRLSPIRIAASTHVPEEVRINALLRYEPKISNLSQSTLTRLRADRSTLIEGCLKLAIEIEMAFALCQLYDESPPTKASDILWIIRTIGIENVVNHVVSAFQQEHNSGPLSHDNSGDKRTYGGIFFQVFKQESQDAYKSLSRLHKQSKKNRGSKHLGGGKNAEEHEKNANSLQRPQTPKYFKQRVPKFLFKDVNDFLKTDS